MSSMVMIMCPTSLQEVPTGILIDEKSLKTLNGHAGERKCPACGQVHNWSLDEAWLSELPVPDTKGSFALQE
jgi:hypothetical protein